jgi:hypothetical protein
VKPRWSHVSTLPGGAFRGDQSKDQDSPVSVNPEKVGRVWVSLSFAFFSLTPLERKGVLRGLLCRNGREVMSLRDPECQDQPLVRHNPCPISEQQGTGKPPGEKSRPVVVEAERRKNMGLVKCCISPTRFLAAQESDWSNGLHSLSQS